LGLLYTSHALTALIAIRPESIISLHHLLGHVDDYVGALSCLHCRSEKGKP